MYRANTKQIKKLEEELKAIASSKIQISVSDDKSVDKLKSIPDSFLPKINKYNPEQLETPYKNNNPDSNFNSFVQEPDVSPIEIKKSNAQSARKPV